MSQVCQISTTEANLYDDSWFHGPIRKKILSGGRLLMHSAGLFAYPCRIAFIKQLTTLLILAMTAQTRPNAICPHSHSAQEGGFQWSQAARPGRYRLSHGFNMV